MRMWIVEAATPKKPPSASTDAEDHIQHWYQLLGAALKNVSFETRP